MRRAPGMHLDVPKYYLGKNYEATPQRVAHSQIELRHFKSILTCPKVTIRGGVFDNIGDILLPYFLRPF